MTRCSVGLDALDRGAELVDDGVDGLEHALAAVAAVVAVAQLVQPRTRRSMRRRGRPARATSAVVEQDLDLNGRVSARVQNFASA